MSHLVVYNLPNIVTKEILKSIFGVRGNIVNILLLFDVDKIDSGFAIINFQNKDECAAVINYFYNVQHHHLPPTLKLRQLSEIADGNESPNVEMVNDNIIYMQCKIIIQKYEQNSDLDDIIYLLVDDQQSLLCTRHEEFVKSMSLATLYDCHPNCITKVGVIFIELLIKNIISITAIIHGIGNALKEWKDNHPVIYPELYSQISALISPIIILDTTVSIKVICLKNTFTSLQPDFSIMMFVEVLQSILQSTKSQDLKLDVNKIKDNISWNDQNTVKTLNEVLQETKNYEIKHELINYPTTLVLFNPDDILQKTQDNSVKHESLLIKKLENQEIRNNEINIKCIASTNNICLSSPNTVLQITKNDLKHEKVNDVLEYSVLNCCFFDLYEMQTDNNSIYNDGITIMSNILNSITIVDSLDEDDKCSVINPFENLLFVSKKVIRHDENYLKSSTSLIFNNIKMNREKFKYYIELLSITYLLKIYHHAFNIKMGKNAFHKNILGIQMCCKGLEEIKELELHFYKNNIGPEEYVEKYCEYIIDMIKGDGIDSCADIIYGILQSKISKNTVLVSSLRMDEPIEYACNFLISFEKELRNNTVKLVNNVDHAYVMLITYVSKANIRKISFKLLVLIQKVLLLRNNILMMGNKPIVIKEKQTKSIKNVLTEKSISMHKSKNYEDCKNNDNHETALLRIVHDNVDEIVSQSFSSNAKSLPKIVQKPCEIKRISISENKGQSSINKINKKVITNLTGGVLYSTKYNEIKQDKKEPKNRIAVCPANFMIKENHITVHSSRKKVNKQFLVHGKKCESTGLENYNIVMNPAELNMQLPGHLINYATNEVVFSISPNSVLRNCPRRKTNTLIDHSLVSESNNESTSKENNTITSTDNNTLTPQTNETSTTSNPNTFNVIENSLYTKTISDIPLNFFSDSSQTVKEPDESTLISDKMFIKFINSIQKLAKKKQVDEIMKLIGENNINYDIPLKHEIFVVSLIVVSMNGTFNGKKNIGDVLTRLVSNNIITIQSISNGINRVLRNWDTFLLIDIQKFVLIADIFVPLLISNCFEFNDVINCLIDINKDYCLNTFIEILNAINKRMELSNITEYNGAVPWTYYKWNKSKHVESFVKLISNTSLNVYLMSNGLTRVASVILCMALYDIIRNCKNDIVYVVLTSWVQANLDIRLISYPSFTRSLTIAVILAIVSGNTFDGTFDNFFQQFHIMILKYFVLNEQWSKICDVSERQLHCLYGVQIASASLKYPKNMILKIFEKLYQSKIITKEAFNLWKSEETFKTFPEDWETKSEVIKLSKPFFKIFEKKSKKEETVI